MKANIIISRVDCIKTKFEIAALITKMDSTSKSFNRPVYWMDFGNSPDSVQVILSTIGEVKQPTSTK